MPMWLIGAVVCLLAALETQLFSDASNGWLHRLMHISSVTARGRYSRILTSSSVTSLTLDDLKGS